MVRLTALALAAAFVLLLPAGASAATTSVEKRSASQRTERALRTAQRARQLGNAALRRASRAVQDARRANKRLDGLTVRSDSDAGTVTTGSDTDYVDLGGPNVNVDVPESGLIEVWATVTFDDPSDGQVALYEDGERVPIDDGLGVCSGGSLGDVLLSAFAGPGGDVTLSTPAAPILGLGCGTPGQGASPVLFETTPGGHTYDLRYADCGCEPGDASFSDRTLRVSGR
ncbi:MAG: hypothetical protein U0R51_02005 [Solirubrobacterales bacterium]